MRAQRIGDALLRTKSSPILAFLAPSLPLSAWNPLRRNVVSPLGSPQFLVNLQCLATKTSPLNASSATAAKGVEDGAVPPLSVEPDTTFASRSILNELVGKVVSTNSGFTSKKPTPASPSYAAIPDRSTSAAIFGKAIKEFARKRSYLNERQGQIAGSLNWGDQTKSEFTDLDSGADYIRASAPLSEPVQPPPAPVRLDAFIGRSEEVNPLKGVDLARALRKLEIKCAYNKVKQDFNKQRFHERPGLKRKRLKSQRWRKRFKEGFKAVVAKVQDMRMRGW